MGGFSFDAQYGTHSPCAAFYAPTRTICREQKFNSAESKCGGCFYGGVNFVLCALSENGKIGAWR